MRTQIHQAHQHQARANTSIHRALHVYKYVHLYVQVYCVLLHAISGKDRPYIELDPVRAQNTCCGYHTGCKQRIMHTDASKDASKDTLWLPYTDASEQNHAWRCVRLNVEAPLQLCWQLAV